MKLQGIGFKLTAVMLVIILLGIIITTGIAAVISGNVIIDETVSKVEQETKAQALVMDEWITYHMATVATLATVLSQVDDYSKDNLTGILATVKNKNSVYQDVYVGFPDNTAIMGSGYPIEEAYASGWKATERIWYEIAMKNTNAAGVTSLYVDTATGDLCITASHAIVRDGVVRGVAAIDMNVNVLQDIISSATLDGKGHSLLLDSNGDIFIHMNADYAPNNKGEFKNLGTVKNNHYSELWKKISISDEASKYNDADGSPNYYIARTLGTTGWKMVATLPESVVTQPIRTVLYIVIPLAVAILALAALFIYIFVANMISKPLAPLSAFMKKASTTGDLKLSPVDLGVIGKYSQRADEIGQTINNTAAFISQVSNISNKLETVANGDLTTEVEVLSDNDAMGKSINHMVGNLSGMFGEINSVASQVSSGSKQAADGAQALAQASTEQAESIAELSLTIARIAERTKTNAVTADKTSKLSGTIKESAEKGSRQMDEMIAAVEAINEASRNISKIIKTIDDIAFQTNILALNAAVEAARAGQHGKGFAVVAEEVRNLASKSAEAAKDTGNMIQNSMEKAELGARIAGETAASLSEIVTGINESSHLITEIADASEEQTLGISQINVGIDQVAQVVQQNSATAEESAATSEEMSGQSGMLLDLIAHFKLKEDRAMVRRLPPA